MFESAFSFFSRKSAGISAVALGVAVAMTLTPASAQQTDFSIALPSATVLPYHGFVFLGIPAGFYADLGLDAEYLTINGSAAALQLVASGEAQMAHIGLSALIAAKRTQPNLPVRAVFLQDVRPIYSIGIPAGSGIDGLEGLRGKRIGVLNMASGAVPWTKAYLAANGIAETEYELLAIGSGAQAYAVLQAGQVDAIAFSTGLSAALEYLGADLTYHTAEEPSGVMIANENYVAQNPAAAAAALQGIILSQTFMQINPEASVEYYWETVGTPEGLTREEAMRQGLLYIERTAEIWKDYRSDAPWGLMSDETWTGLLEFEPIAESFASDAELQAFVSSLYTNALIEEANTVDLSIAISAAEAAR